MKKLVTAVLVGLTLTLTACGEEGDPPPTTTTEAAETTTEAASGIQDLILGDTMTVTRCGGDVPCEIDITLSQATLTETCPHGVSYPDMQAMDPEGSLYLTFEGEFHVIDSQTNFSVAETDFTAVDPEGYATSNLIAYDCENLGVDKNLSNPVDPGLKRSGQLILAIPDNTETVRFTQYWDPVTYEFDVTDLDVEPGAGERPLPASASTTSAGSEDATEPTTESMEPSDDAGEANSASIWNEPGIGYNCAATDAWTDDPANCTAANLGGDPAYDIHWGPDAASPANDPTQDLSNIPYSEGGTCPAYRCGYGTDAEGNDLNQEKADSHAWWNECIAANTAEYCRANDPWQQ